MPRPESEQITLLLVDDHEIVRIGLRALFTRTRSIRVVGEAGTAASALEEVERLRPAVVLMDLHLPDESGVAACREIRAACADARVLFLTSYSDRDAVLATIFAGAAGYLLKEIGGEALIQAVEKVAAGQSILDPAVTRIVLERMKVISGQDDSALSLHKDKRESLSPQEQRVLALVASGKTNKEIAIVLELSEKTVKNYLNNIFQKLQVSRRAHAAAIFIADFGQSC
jgi:two-component system response regulator DevR